jgi:hypothetical protein
MADTFRSMASRAHRARQGAGDPVHVRDRHQIVVAVLMGGSVNGRVEQGVHGPECARVRAER